MLQINMFTAYAQAEKISLKTHINMRGPLTQTQFKNYIYIMLLKKVYHHLFIYLFSLLFTIEKGFSKSYLHITI